MVSNNISHLDGTYGRKLFYEARGYTGDRLLNQKTDNNSGGYTLANFQAEIDVWAPRLAEPGRAFGQRIQRQHHLHLISG